MGSRRGGCWTCFCPLCGRSVPIGDGPQGTFIAHPVNYAPWTGATGTPCAGSGLTISEARDRASAATR